MARIHDLIKSRVGVSTCFCGKDDKFKLSQKKFHNGVGYHVGIVCEHCRTRMKWVSQEDIRDWKKVEADEQPTQEALW